MEKTRKTRTEDGKLNLLGERIAQLRKKSGLSQNSLARELQLLGVNLNKNAVSNIELGKRSISDIELFAIIAALHVSTMVRKNWRTFKEPDALDIAKINPPVYGREEHRC